MLAGTTSCSIEVEFNAILTYDRDSLLWGISSAGRALRWQRRGQRFDPAMLHQTKQAT